MEKGGVGEMGEEVGRTSDYERKRRREGEGRRRKVSSTVFRSKSLKLPIWKVFDALFAVKV